MKHNHKGCATAICTTLLVFCTAAQAENEQLNNIFLKEFTLTAEGGDTVYKSTDYAGTAYNLGGHLLNNDRTKSLKDLSLSVANLYIPSYGSKTTSSIYARGISTRMNEPAIGLYIDGVPVINKSCYDFELFNISNAQIAMGPQGTLYGRNTIAGVIDLQTIDQKTFDGTPKIGFQASYGRWNTTNDMLTVQLGNKRRGIALSGHYSQSDGWIKNYGNGNRNNMMSAGGRVNGFWNIGETWHLKLNAGYDHSDENAYPYQMFTPTAGKRTISNDSVRDVNYNENGSYRRDYVMSGLTVEKDLGKSKLSSTTGYQYLDDDMRLDMDYTSDSIFRMSDKQRQHMVTEELTFRTNMRTYKQTTGAFGFYSNNEQTAPVGMGEPMVKVIQGRLDQIKLNNPRMPEIRITNKKIDASGDFTIQNYGGALFHQSSVTLWERLTLTAGLRAEYNKVEIDYGSKSPLSTLVSIQIPHAGTMTIPKDSTYALIGNNYKEYWKLLPKASIRYKLSSNVNIYATIAKGYKAGGYNTAITSQIIQDMMMNKKIEDVNNILYYKPEYLWNYELGIHSEPIEDKLYIDGSLFFIDDRDQQLVRSNDNGTRNIVNAEKVHSYGGEFTIRANPIKDLLLTTSYGYTHAEFRRYTAEGVNMKGNRLPFSPENTFDINAQYDIRVGGKVLEKIRLQAGYRGLGNIYWDDENRYREDFYGTMSASLGLIKGRWSLTGWVNDISFDGKHNTFYFESNGNKFVQQTAPISYGATLRLDLTSVVNGSE